MDEHGLAPFDGEHHPVDRHIEIPHQGRRVQLLEAGTKEALGGFDVRETAGAEELAHGEGEMELGRQRPRRGVIGALG